MSTQVMDEIGYFLQSQTSLFFGRKLFIHCMIMEVYIFQIQY